MQKLSELFSRARAAEEVLLDPVLTEAFRMVKARALLSIETTAPADTAAREDAYQRVRALRDVEQELKKFIELYKVEKARLDRLEKRDKRPASEA